MSALELFRASGVPVLQNRTFATADEARRSASGDVVLVQDPGTGLIVNSAFDASKMIYDGAYQNEQACSKAFRHHLDEVAGIVERHWRSKRLLEIGCGKGYFLEHLRGRGFDIRGIDPAYEGSNPRITKGYFHEGLGLTADAIVLRHVLEHIPDPLVFLSMIARANEGRGEIYIEVPNVDWILAHRAWFDIFYEHVNYFRPIDFSRMFGRIHQRGLLFGGQYQFVVADLASLRAPLGTSDAAVEWPSDFLAAVDRAASRGRDGRRRHVVWGGASKGVIFSLYMQRAGITIDEVIDINPAKQGRYLALTGLRVSPPEEALSRLMPRDVIFVMNSNYRDEIVAASGNQYTYVTVDVLD